MPGLSIRSSSCLGPAIPDDPHLDYHPYDGSVLYHYIPQWPQLRPVWCQSVGATTEWRCKEKVI